MSPIGIKVVECEEEWDALQADWDGLFANSPQAATPLRFFWMRQWWRIYGHDSKTGDSGLRIITFWRDDALVGVLPLYCTTVRPALVPAVRLGFLSSGETAGEATCADYLNLLCLPDAAGECLAALPEVLQQLKWDVLDLPDVPADSPLAIQSQQAGEALAIVAQGVCPAADLTGGFDAYLARLSANTRQNARRQLRAVEKAEAVFELATPDNAQSCYEAMIELHQARWTEAGKPGCFSSLRFTEFHRTLVQEWIPGGEALLARLSLGGETLAVLYGFVTGSKFDFYQSGVRHLENGPLTSAGITAHLLLMSHLAGRGIATYDFLRGNEQYKERLATHQRPTVALRAWRPTLSATAWRSSQTVGQAARRWAKLLGRLK